MFYKEVRHVKRTHPHKPKQWQQRKYWGRLNLERQDHWLFGNKQTGHHLLKYGWFPIEKPIPGSGAPPPEDPAHKKKTQKRNATKANNKQHSRQKIPKHQRGIGPASKSTLFTGHVQQLDN